jgi:hypothetical protein
LNLWSSWCLGFQSSFGVFKTWGVPSCWRCVVSVCRSSWSTSTWGVVDRIQWYKWVSRSKVKKVVISFPVADIGWPCCIFDVSCWSHSPNRLRCWPVRWQYLLHPERVTIVGGSVQVICIGQVVIKFRVVRSKEFHVFHFV